VTDMKKPRLFIGSSVEGKEIADTLQVLLDYDAEVTVWHQGVFGLSQGSLESIVNAAREDNFDFAALVLTPDDLVSKRGENVSSSRDNVIFELGLFMGSLGRDRTFIVYCRDIALDLPSDLAGVTPATFADREDKNLRAALGPVRTQIMDAIKKLNPIDQGVKSAVIPVSQTISYSDEDARALLASWLGKRTLDENTSAINFSEVDKQLGLELGSTKRHIKELATKYNYEVEHEGDVVIKFRRRSQTPRRTLGGY
jgi:hypothetical protein